MTTRQHIRNPAAFHKAEERRKHRQARLIEGISHRINPIVRKKFYGTLTAPCLDMVLTALEQNGGIDPDARSSAKQLKIHPQVVMRRALDLAVERGDISMSQSDCGEIMVFIWPPMGLEEIDAIFGNEAFAEAWPTIMFLGFFFADGVL